ncbi:hypothetical protein [Clostridium sp.]|uniref:hypothetical protein n=1 Tax=Clostridium sp. TaxID=1506 RepID=UPI0026DCAB5A|nr:hypothetical protein [Clostridium sp.]MDO5040247.1 hypothetical protein [Clostridium sp.]
MGKVLILSRGTGQAKEFKKALEKYTNENGMVLNYIFSNEENMNRYIKTEDINVVLISPEMMLVEEQIKLELEKNKLPYIELRPVDFGLKRIEKVMPLINKYL